MSNSYQLGRKGEAEAISKFSADVNVARSSCCAQSIGIHNIKTNKCRFSHGYYFKHKYQKSSHYLMQKLQPLLNGTYLIKS